MTDLRYLEPQPVTVWPSHQEFRTLYSTVLGCFPELEPVSIQEFVSAFESVARIYRRTDGKLNMQRDLAFWKRIANARRLDGSVEISHLGLIAGLTAWGDVRMVDWRKEAYSQGVRFACDLDEYSGRLPVDQWRGVLEGKTPALIDPRPKTSKGMPIPKVSVLVDGRPLPVNRYQGPEYF